MLKLIIRLYEDNSELADWAVFSSNGELQHSFFNAHLSRIKSPTEDYETIVAVPGKQILLTTVNIPTTNRSKLIQAIPYAMETEIAEEIENTHFTIGTIINNQVSVACVNKKSIARWLEVLTAVNIKPKIMTPDFLLLPEQEKTWTLLTDRHGTLVKINNCCGFTANQENLAAKIDIALNDKTLNKPNNILWLVCGEQKMSESLLSEVKINITKQQTCNYFSCLTEHTLTSISLNLLQGAYKPKLKLAKFNKQWRWTIITAACWILLLLLSYVTKFGYLKFEQHQLQTKINNLYNQVFPNAAKISDPRLMLSAKLHKFREPLQNYQFLFLLSKIAPAIHSVNNITLQKIVFHDKQFEITIKADNFTTIDALASNLKQQQISVQQEKAISNNDNVLAVLRIST